MGYPDLTQWGVNDTVTGGAAGNLNTRLEEIFQSFSGEITRTLQVLGTVGFGAAEQANTRFYISDTTAFAGNSLALDIDKTGASTTNIALRLSSSAATNNTALATDAGSVIFANSASYIPQAVDAITSVAQIHGTNAAGSTAIIGRWSADATGPSLNFVKSRNAAIAGITIVNNADAVGSILACADDGTDYISRVAQILFSIDGAPGANDTPGRIAFLTTADGAQAVTERMRIDNAGRVIIGGTSSITISGSDAPFQIHQASNSQFIIANYQASSTGPFIVGMLSRDPAIGGNTIVVDGDICLDIIGVAADGVDFGSQVAEIQFRVDGTPGAGDTPGRIVFLTTADGVDTTTERMRIDSRGNLYLGGTTSLGAATTNSYGVFSGTAPAAGVANCVIFYSSDNAADNTIPSFYCEGTDVDSATADVAAARLIRVRINGTVRTLMAST